MLVEAHILRKEKKNYFPTLEPLLSARVRGEGGKGQNFSFQRFKRIPGSKK